MNNLVTFCADFFQRREELCEENPDAFACITVDGYPSDEKDKGQAICKVWITMHRDVIVSWNLNAYRLAPVVLELIESAKKRLFAAWDDAHNVV